MERFHQRMINVNPSLLSKIAFNTHANEDTPWNYPGGTAIQLTVYVEAIIQKMELTHWA